MFREYFPFYEKDNQITYLDSANTSQILGSCLSSYIKYHYDYNYNIGRTSYAGARYAQQLRDWAAQAAGLFLGTDEKHILFTSGATEGLNLVAQSFCGLARKLKRKLILLTSELEHASAILPWMAFGKNLIEIHYVELNEDFTFNLDNFKKAVDELEPDIILFASMTNTTGETRPIKEIGAVAKEHQSAFIVDHAQGAAHVQINVDEMNIDFLSCSLHKMYGPKGVGILYARRPNFLKPMKLGGGMNKWFEKDGEFEVLDTNEKFVAGTENVPSIFSSIDSIEFLMQHWNEVQEHMLYLGYYAHKLLSRLPKIKIYSTIGNPIILFNFDDFEALDVMNYLDKKNIYIRAGNHCAKLTRDLFGLSTCRISLGVYNTEEDLNKLYYALKEMLGDELCLENAQDQKTVEFENVEQIPVR